MSIPIRFQFIPRVVKGVMNGASQVLPTGAGQILYYEIVDGAYSTNALGVATLQGEGRKVGVIAYDFVNSRWAALFTQNGVLSTHQSTVYENDIAQITIFIATLSSPPVPLTDEVGNDVPWPASIPEVQPS
jgi:hypothetical protein